MRISRGVISDAWLEDTVVSSRDAEALYDLAAEAVVDGDPGRAGSLEDLRALDLPV